MGIPNGWAPPGETKTVILPLTKKQLDAYEAEGRMVMARGRYNLYPSERSSASAYYGVEQALPPTE